MHTSFHSLFRHDTNSNIHHRRRAGSVGEALEGEEYYQENIIREAIDQYVAEFTLEEKKKKLKAAAGMWKDRDEDDIPNVRDLREGWGRRLKRLGIDDR